RFGREKLLAILKDLGNGAEMNDTLARQTVPMAQLEKDFGAFARKIAEEMAPGLGWEKPASVAGGGGGPSREEEDELENEAGTMKRRGVPAEGWANWARYHPTNYWAMTYEADRAVAQKKWSEAKSVLESLVKLYPDSTGSDSAYRKLATVYR